MVKALDRDLKDLTVLDGKPQGSSHYAILKKVLSGKERELNRESYVEE